MNKDNTSVLSSARLWHLPLLIVLLSFVAPNQTGTSLFSGTTIWWIVSFTLIACVFWYKKKFFHPSNKKDYKIVHFFLLWMLLGVIRGIFVVEDYWEWKQLIFGTLALSLPIFIYVFSIPLILQKTLKLWLKILPLAFISYIAWKVLNESFHYYLSPILLLGCFLPVIPRNWRIVIIGFLLVLIFADFFARAQVLKAVISLLMSIAYMMFISERVSVRLLRPVHTWLYLTPIILLITGISGIFNPFQAFQEDTNIEYSQTNTIYGFDMEENISDDTRTFIYEEVISSALTHNYVLHGRTPARGNDSEAFGAHSAEELGTGKYERHSNEVCHPNVFTWLGLIGVILYSMIYFRSSYLALFKSKNIALKLLGIYIAFRWAYGWIEDNSALNMVSVSLWMIIAMGFSEEFREMTDKDFKEWIIGILPRRKKDYPTDYY